MRITIGHHSVSIAKEKYGRLSIWVSNTPKGMVLVKVIRRILRPFGYTVTLRGRRLLYAYGDERRRRISPGGIPLDQAKFAAMYFDKKKYRARAPKIY